MTVLDAFKLDGQVALVTGGGSGLGWAMAQGMAEAGADVVCADWYENRAKEAAEMIRGVGRRGLAITADVSKEAAGEPEPLLEEPVESWQEAIDIDLTSVFLTAREGARVMIPQGRGKIITISSITGAFVGRGLRPGYSAAKGGVVGLTWTLALILAPYGIQVNCIAPGYFKTALGRGRFLQKELDEETRRSIAEELKNIPLGRIAEPSEIRGLALLLASSASDYMTGCVIPIDGGYVVR